MLDRTHGKEITLHKERCFLCTVVTPDRNIPGEDPLDELSKLISTAGGEEVGRLYQRQDSINFKTYFGKGKLLELAEAVIATQADTIVVDDDLSPKQLSQLEDTCRRKVIDRNEVILDIFQSNAKSHQAKLQVELAQLQYELPRLVRKWTHLERLGGGIGTRGPGESQLETDRRLLRSKISSLQLDLEKIASRKQREVEKRSLFTACLVGYTNSGKSSLMNSLTHADTLVENRLFATLDTLTRKLSFSDDSKMLLSDTVGFIRRLPHHLVASFHATLEEASQADLLLHVVDASDPLARFYISSVEDTLSDLGMSNHPTVYLFNKVDQVHDQAKLTALHEHCTPFFDVSALTGFGLEELGNFLKSRITANRQQVRLLFSSSDGKRFSLLHELCNLHSVNYIDDRVEVIVDIHQLDLDKLKSLPGVMSVEPILNTLD